MSKITFVNWEILKNHIPVFINPPITTEEQADKLIELIEDGLILKKAEEIKKKREIEKD